MKLSYSVRMILVVLFFCGVAAASGKDGYDSTNVWTEYQIRNSSASDGIIKGRLDSVWKYITKKNEVHLTFTVFLENLTDVSQTIFFRHMTEICPRFPYTYLQVMDNNKWRYLGNGTQLLSVSDIVIPPKEKDRLDFVIEMPEYQRKYLEGYRLRIVVGGHDVTNSAWKGVLFIEFTLP